MSVKKKSKSRYFFTMFLAGSLCGSINYMQADPDASSDDLSEEPQHRIQITGALNVTLAAIDTAVEVLTGGNPTVNLSTVQDNGVPTGTVIEGGTTYTPHTNDLTSLSLGVSTIKGTDFNPATDSLKAISDVVSSFNADLDGVATSAQAVDIMGTGFDTATDSLEAISNALIVVDGIVDDILVDTGTTLPAQIAVLGSSALATSAQAVDILGTNVTTTVIAGADAGYTTDTNDLTAISQGLSSIKGTGFAPATDSLKIISDNQTTQGLVALATNAQAVSILANQTSQGTAALATSAQADAIQGAGFVEGTDSLEAISNALVVVDGIVDDILVDTGTTLPAQIAVLGSSALATAANLSTTNTTVNTINSKIGDPLVGGGGSTLALVLGNSGLLTNSASISASLGNIQGASFNTATDSLKVISDDTDTIIANQTSQGTGALATAANLATLQTTANTINTNVTTLGTAALATSAQAIAIQGATFATGTDSLEAISNNTTSVPLATNAQAVSILANQTSQGTSTLATSAQAADILVDTAVIGTAVNTGGVATIAGILGDPGADTAALSISASLGGIEGTTFDTATDSLEVISDKIGSPVNTGAGADTLAGILGDPGAQTISASTSIAAALGAIEGASFTTGLAALFIISRQTALAQVVAAASSSAIITDATAGGVGFLNFNITLANLRAAIITATAVGGQTKVNIDAITSTADLAFTSAATETITAPFTQAAYQAALQALSLASINWSAFYS